MAAFKKLKKLNFAFMGLVGKPPSIRTECFNFSRFVDKLCRAPGRVPIEFAKLTKLANLQLHHNDGLQAPEGTPMHSGYDDMDYGSRGVSGVLEMNSQGNKR